MIVVGGDGTGRRRKNSGEANSAESADTYDTLEPKHKQSAGAKRLTMRSASKQWENSQQLPRTSSRYRQTAVDLAAEVVQKLDPEKISLLDKVVYTRDKMLEKQHLQPIFLGLLFIVVVSCCAAMHMLAEYEEDYDDSDWCHNRTGETEHDFQVRCSSFPQHLWLAWVYMADPGTHADASTPIDRAVSGFIAVVGIFFFASILGFVVDSVREIMDTLNKGKSKVVESGHTLILGWTDRTPALIQEIALASESEGGGTVVILSSRDKQELELELKANISKKELRGLKVVFRNGSSMVMKDLNCVSACSARNIIILAPTGMEADKADSVVLRTVLQLKGLRHELSGHVVAELRDVDNETLVQMVGMGSVETVVSHDIVGRLMLMAVRQPGLARVYDSILGFEGDEFYLKDWTELHGVKFKELPLRLPQAVPLGIKRVGADTVELNPDGESKLGPGDELLVLASDDDSYAPLDSPVRISDLGTVPKDTQDTVSAERILMCGWRRDVDDIIKELDNMVVKGSQLHMLCEVPIMERDGILEKGGLHIANLQNISIVHHLGNSAVRRQIEELPVEDYDSILILADEAREADMMHSDSHTLASLLLIRDIQNRRINPALYERKEFLAGVGVGAGGAGAGAGAGAKVGGSGSDSGFEEETEETGLGSKRQPRHMQTSQRRASSSGGGMGVKAGAVVQDHTASHRCEHESLIAINQKQAQQLAKQVHRHSICDDEDPEEVQGCLSVCEVLDHRTRFTIESSRSLNQASDFVQSNEFVSRVLAMVAERREVKSVLDCLLGSTGSSLCVNSPVRYAHEHERLSYYSMAMRVQGYKEILCGYKKHGQPPELNPKNKEELMVWDDVELIVLSAGGSEEEGNSENGTGKPAMKAASPEVENKKVEAVAKRVSAQLSGLTQQTQAQVLETAREAIGTAQG